jgi:pimeloyl-ACP methyl ester carboxylesterase
VRRLLSFALALLVLYGVYAAVLFAAQRRMFYPGRRIGAVWSPPGTHAPNRLSLETSQGPVEAIFLPPARVGSATRFPALLLAHGNAEVMDDWVDRVQGFRDLGLGVLLVEYPGYGRSAGAPSEGAIREALLVAYDALRGLPGVDPESIVAFGQSLGGGAVCTLVARRPLKAVILLSTFTSARPFAHRYGLPSFLVRDTFDNVAALKGYDGPVLVLHGRSDATIPVTEGRALARASPRATLREYDCAHGCWEPDRLPLWSDLRAFLAESGVRLASREP